MNIAEAYKALKQGRVVKSKVSGNTYTKSLTVTCQKLSDITNFDEEFELVEERPKKLSTHEVMHKLGWCQIKRIKGVSACGDVVDIGYFPHIDSYCLDINGHREGRIPLSIIKLLTIKEWEVGE